MEGLLNENSALVGAHPPSQSESLSISACSDQPGDGLHIVHLAKYYPPASGGIESHVRTLALQQARLGCTVDVVAVNHMAPNGKNGELEEVTFEHFTRTRSCIDRDASVKIHRLGRLFTVARFDAVARLVPRLVGIARDKPSVWHLHMPNITMSMASLLTPGMRPLVITHHSDIIRQKRLGRMVSPLLKKVYKRSAAIYATSPLYAEHSPLLQANHDKVTCLPLGIDLERFQKVNDASRAYAQQLRERIIGPLWLTVGRMVYYKGMPTALRALREVPGTLVCIGEGPQREALCRHARELGVADRIEWLGRVSDDQLVGAYHAADALWMPSSHKSEAFGLVQVEAMASGLPVVNTHIPGSGVPWVCQHGVAGLTVPVEDDRAFAQAALAILQEPGLRERLSETARQEAASRFSADKMARESIHSYRAIVSARTRVGEPASKFRRAPK